MIINMVSKFEYIKEKQSFFTVYFSYLERIDQSNFWQLDRVKNKYDNSISTDFVHTIPR